MLFKLQRPPLPVFAKPAAEIRVALLLFVLFTLIISLSLVFFRPVADLSEMTAESRLRSSVVWSVMLLPFIVVLVIRKQSLDTCFIPRKGLLLHLLVSVPMGFLGVFVYLLAIGKPSQFGVVAGKLFTVSSLFLLAPMLLEEFVFRGFLLARLTASLGRHKGVLLSAAMFGLAHYPRYLASSHMSFLQVTPTILLIIAVSVGGGYGIYAIRCMFYGVFIHWAMDVVQMTASTG